MKKQSKVKRNKKSGVTLISLVITIIVLLILAGITINLIIGEDGIIKRAQQAGKNYIAAAENERWQLGQFTNEMDNIISSSANNGRTPYNSEFRNKVIAAIYEEGVETLETDTDEVIIENIGKIFEERTKIDSEIAAIADNITTGKQAYVNGELITGTGKDAGAQYSQGFIDGQQNVTDNLKVTYTYHVHSGSAGTTANGCYTKATYHSHTSSCNQTCYVNRVVVLKEYGSYQSNCFLCGQGGSCHAECYIQYVHKQCGQTSKEGFLKCGGCGKYFSGNGKQIYPPSAGTTTNYTSHSYNICGKTTSTIEGYVLGCGKTEETIESATIEY